MSFSGSSVTVPLPTAAFAQEIALRILETTDLHMHLFPYDYYAARRSASLGLAHAARVIAALRATSPNVLLFDNGDFLQGSPLGDFAASGRGRARGGLHPAVSAMNRLGYDAVTLGNHEFNYGLGFLEQALGGAAFPVVTANVVRSLGAAPRADRTLLPPYVLLDRVVVDGAGRPHPLRIGVIGLVPPQTAMWDRDHLDGRVWVRDIVATARAWVPEMREAGAALVVALAHTGIGAAQETDGMENAAVPLAAVPGIDVLLLGHAHLMFPSPRYAVRPGVDVLAGTIGGKPSVMAGCYGSHVGIVDLRLSRDDGRWRIVAARSEARAIAEDSPGGMPRARTAVPTAFLSEARGLHAATRRFMAGPVGLTAVPLQSHFALVSDTAALRIVGAATTDHVARAIAGTADAALPVLAAVAPFKAGGRGGPCNFTDIPAGPLVRRHVADLYAFDNRIRAIRATGADLRAWLERSAALYLPIVPGVADQPLIDPDYPSYGFEMIVGLSYRIDPGRSAADRIVDLCRRGLPVADDDLFIVATNSYRLATWQAETGQPPPTTVLEEPEAVRDVVARWITAQSGPVPVPPPGWSLSLPRGASVVFDTSPAADPTALLPLAAERVGTVAGGFVRVRIIG